MGSSTLTLFSPVRNFPRVSMLAFLLRQQPGDSLLQNNQISIQSKYSVRKSREASAGASKGRHVSAIVESPLVDFQTIWM